MKKQKETKIPKYKREVRTENIRINKQQEIHILESETRVEEKIQNDYHEQLNEVIKKSSWNISIYMRSGRVMRRKLTQQQITYHMS